MKAAIHAILLFVISTGCTRASQKLTQCRDSCITKITDIRLCNEACVHLPSTSSDSNSITAPPPVPDPPLLLSSTYFTFTLQWNDYPATKYNASPVVYVLEVTRHENTSDPAIILPFLTKYHKTKNTTFTIPQQFVTKTNFSFRLAVVAAQGTSNFSAPSPLYLTNDTCDRGLHAGIFDTGHFPCPVFNLRINFTATEVMFDVPRISTTLYWDYPHDIHTNLEGQRLDLHVSLSDEFPYSREQECARHGVQFHPDDIAPEHPSTSESYPLPSNQKDQMYFGCPYKLELFSEFEKYSNTTNFVTVTTFYIPHCIHGFCGCDIDNSSRPKEDSEYVDVNVRQSNHSINLTTANITWRNEAWGNKIPEYFKLVILECPNDKCPSLHLQNREILLADPTKTSHSYILPNLTEGEGYFVVIAAFDKSGCKLIPTEGQKFKASVPLPTTPGKQSSTPLSNPTTSSTRQTKGASVPLPTTPGKQSSTPLSNPTTPSTRQTKGVTTTANEGLPSATIAAITVPIVLLLIFAIVLLVLCRVRLHRKPHRLQRAPTGLQRLAEHMQNTDRDNCHRNRQHDFSSPYSSDYDRSELVVNLPSKSEGGLELNPAYVEQRIQEAVETGDADEFEFGYHRLELKRILGKGAFGKVFLAEAYGIGGSQGTTLVAVKVLNEKANEDEKEDFKMEINFMKTLGRHENVVTMIGCCTFYPPVCLIVEYVPNGDLLHYLRNLRKTFEMQNRKLQGEDIEKLKNEAKSASSEAQITSAESVMGPGSYSRRPLVPSASETALSELSHDADQKPLKAKKRRLLRQCKSEGKQLSIGNAFKKYEKFFEPEELAKIKRTHSASSFLGLSANNLYTPRRASDSPQVHYVTRVPPIATDVSNTTETTLVLDTKATVKSQPSSPSRTMGLDGALDASDLQSFALQIANGMAYLAGRGIIHRDLATRNILVGDEKVLKISDFGLSREGIYVKRSTGKIPLRWLSIEAMRDRIYSTASDVWAFGIVLWEICTLGGFPYPTMNDRDLLEFLLEGNRMDKPDNCTEEIYQIMLACWARDCEDRPSFQALSEHLFDMEKEEHPYVNVDPSQDFILPPTAGQDTIGNLINFSDGTFSGASDDRELSEPVMHHNQSIAGRMWPQGDVLPTSDGENAGYESSGASSEDLSEPQAKIAGNDIIRFSQSNGPTNDIEHVNNESPV